MLKHILMTIARFSAAVLFMSAFLPIQSAKAEEPQWCSAENSICYPANGALRDAYYCGAGKCNHRVVSGPFSCNNATFGNPNSSSTKQCYIGDANYAYKYPEWANPNPVGNPVIAELEPVIVAFGALANPVWTPRILGTGNCDTSTFGNDPAPGYAKSCYSGPKFNYCANENGYCTVNGGLYTITMVAFGPYGGPFNYKVVTGSVNCNTATFGDPAPGYAKKCYVKP